MHICLWFCQVDFLTYLELLNYFYWKSPILNLEKSVQTRSQVDKISTQGILFYGVKSPLKLAIIEFGFTCSAVLYL
jgi:hypothetical protein